MLVKRGTVGPFFSVERRLTYSLFGDHVRYLIAGLPAGSPVAVLQGYQLGSRGPGFCSGCSYLLERAIKRLACRDRDLHSHDECADRGCNCLKKMYPLRELLGMGEVTVMRVGV